MRVTTLRLANVRAIEAAEFRFMPGFNLIVGVNGVGKTTVLEAISRGLARIIQLAVKVPVSPPSLDAGDVRYEALAATELLDVEIAGEKVRVQDQQFRAGAFPALPGELQGEIDVYAHGLKRRGRLRKAQREAQEAYPVERGPYFVPDEKSIRHLAAQESSALVAVYFSTVRAHADRGSGRSKRAVSHRASAYVDAFTGRELVLSEFADWLDVLRKTAHEREDAQPILNALDAAVQRFLPNYLGIRPSDDGSSHLLLLQQERQTLTANQLSLVERQQLLAILRSVGLHMSSNWLPKQERTLSPRRLVALAAEERAKTLREQVLRNMPQFENLLESAASLPDAIEDEDLLGELGSTIKIDRLPRFLSASQLSDGERSVLALVLDLSRRLAQANITLVDPSANAAAVVLIDELELHLHPRWQRSIIKNLTTTFPNCQFIATTHSPQVVGEVSSGNVVLMHRRGQVEIPQQTFGMDSNWILRHVLEADDRNPDVALIIEAILEALRGGRTRIARAGVKRLRELTGETPDSVGFAARIARAELLDGSPARKKRSGPKR